MSASVGVPLGSDSVFGIQKAPNLTGWTGYAWGSFRRVSLGIRDSEGFEPHWLDWECAIPMVNFDLSANTLRAIGDSDSLEAFISPAFRTNEGNVD